MEQQIKAPFTNEQVIKLNNFQANSQNHPFTCSGEFCDKKEMDEAGFTRSSILQATTQRWICPCGKYTQNWAHTFMIQ